MESIFEEFEDMDFDEYNLNELTEGDILDAETNLNIKLPKEYIELLKIQNGGYLKYNALPVSFKNSYADNHIAVDFLFGIKENEGIYKSKYHLNEWGIKEKDFVTISGDGHTWIVLDYSKNKDEPPTEDLSDYIGGYELSVERAKDLCKSIDTEDILDGISIWACSYKDLTELASTLIMFLETNSYIYIQERASQNLVELISDEFVTDEIIIKKALHILGSVEDSEINSDIKYSHKLLLDFINRN
ncbi:MULTISPECIES: SMI1/KNR4 family protein [Peribacillus]|uniref:SMI1/KNR4 family protein n=1 Tax=Peribacillus frigoritolerans TaxID=450367 RepID=UPI003DA0CF1E